MAEKISLRDQYGKTIAELGEQNEDIVVLDCDLSGSTRTSIFAKKFPHRFFNMGVAEQDMICTAAGLAAGGKIPFASTFAMFATGRAWEQIRQSLCYPKANVKIVASHGGITVGPDGPSHQALEDIAIIRAIPNIAVIVPSDAYETTAAVKAALAHKGPVYIRLSREKFPVIYDSGKTFEIGKSDVIRNGNDVTVLACGLMTNIALQAADEMQKEGESVRVINATSIKPLDEETILQAARETGAFVTAEEHSIIGGLGGAVAELVSENEPVPVVRVGVKDTFASSGNSAELLEEYGLTSKDISNAIRKAIDLKKQACTEKV